MVIGPHIVDWHDSWLSFPEICSWGVCRFDIARNGRWPEYERAIQQIADKVIPILLEPLQANGRKLKPCLIHGAFWKGNMGINLKTRDSIFLMPRLISLTTKWSLVTGEYEYSNPNTNSQNAAKTVKLT